MTVRTVFQMVFIGLLTLAIGLPAIALGMLVADAVVVVTRWKEFEELPALVAKMARPPLVFDGRRMLDRGAVARYDGIGL